MTASGQCGAGRCKLILAFTLDGLHLRRPRRLGQRYEEEVEFTHRLAATYAITTADIATPGSVLVLVFNPPSGNTTSVSGAIGNTFVMGCIAKDSNAVAFTISP